MADVGITVDHSLSHQIRVVYGDPCGMQVCFETTIVEATEVLAWIKRNMKRNVVLKFSTKHDKWHIRKYLVSASNANFGLIFVEEKTNWQYILRESEADMFVSKLSKAVDQTDVAETSSCKLAGAKKRLNDNLRGVFG